MFRRYRSMACSFWRTFPLLLVPLALLAAAAWAHTTTGQVAAAQADPAAATPASFPFYDDFEAGSLGAAWSIFTTNEGRVRVDSGYSYSGAYSLLLDDHTANATFSYAAAELEIDLAGQADVELDFWWRWFLDQEHPGDGVFLSDDDGLTWHRIFAFTASPAPFQNTVIDLDAAAAANGLTFHDHFLIKFQFYDNGPIPSDGYAIDDVRVWSGAQPPPPAASFPFYDDFESGSLGTGWSPWTTEQGRVRVETGYPYSGAYSLLLDDEIADGTFSYAAADLTIDLAGQADVELDFWWRWLRDEAHPDDGVFLSDDGGLTWHQVFTFTAGPASFGNTVVDVDAAAVAHGLTLHDHFLIRFQFYDNGPIPSDGYVIDDVRLRPPIARPVAAFPFYDGFESGALDPVWQPFTTVEGRVQVSPAYPYSGTYSLLLDDYSANWKYSFAAVELAIDLAGQSDVELDFWWRWFHDDEDPEDGVFISDDEGLTWYQIFHFSEVPNPYQHMVLDLDAAAATLGLTLHDHFYIKFQFYDNKSIPYNGYGFDEIRIRPGAP